MRVMEKVSAAGNVLMVESFCEKFVRKGERCRQRKRCAVEKGVGREGNRSVSAVENEDRKRFDCRGSALTWTTCGGVRRAGIQEEEERVLPQHS